MSPSGCRGARLAGRASSHRLGALAVRPGTTSSNWPEPTSTMLVAQALVRNRPRRHISVSSSPSASTFETRWVSASSSAPPQPRTDALTVCHEQPNSAATSLTGRPRPAWRVANRAARDVNNARREAISPACSTAVPDAQLSSGQRQRRLCHTSGHARKWCGCWCGGWLGRSI